MENKKQLDSHLNKRNSLANSQDVEAKVQTDNLTQAVVKLPHVDYVNVSPYSVLTKEFAEQNVKSSAVPFEVNTSEFAKFEVKLPTVETLRAVNVTEPRQVVEETKMIEEVKSKEEKSSDDKRKNEKVGELPEIPNVQPVEKLDKESQMDIMNKLSQLPNVEEVKINTNLNVKLSKEVEEFKVQKEENVPTGMDVLNELQATEHQEKKVNDIKGEVKKATNSLEDLLSSLDDEDGTSGTIGMG